MPAFVLVVVDGAMPVFVVVVVIVAVFVSVSVPVVVIVVAVVFVVVEMVDSSSSVYVCELLIEDLSDTKCCRRWTWYGWRVTNK